jgi:hypothetical protein
MTGAPALQCSGEASTSVTTTRAQFGPKGTTAENSTDLPGEMRIAVTLTLRGACWAANAIYLSGGAGPRARRRLPDRSKTIA